MLRLRASPRAVALPSLAVLVATVGGLSGCGVPARLEAEDDRPFVSARASWHGADGHGVDLQAVRVRARSGQTLADLDTVTLGTGSVAGPTSLQHRVQQDQAQLAYSNRIRFSHHLDMHWMVGAVFTRSDWQSTSSRATDPLLESRTSWYGPMGGARVRYDLDAQWSLEARATGGVGLGGRARSAGFGSGEAVVGWRPLPQGLVLRAGYGAFQSETRPLPGDTRQVLRVSGPTFNLALEF